MNNPTLPQQLELERVVTLASLSRLSQLSLRERLPIQQQMQTKLSRIEAAQQRCSEGHYGICQQCQHPITAERLEALPYVELCFPCRRQLEGQTLK